jgi:hypothetical protein
MSIYLLMNLIVLIWYHKHYCLFYKLGQIKNNLLRINLQWYDSGTSTELRAFFFKKKKEIKEPWLTGPSRVWNEEVNSFWWKWWSNLTWSPNGIYNITLILETKCVHNELLVRIIVILLDLPVTNPDASTYVQVQQR